MHKKKLVDLAVEINKKEKNKKIFGVHFIETNFNQFSFCCAWKQQEVQENLKKNKSHALLMEKIGLSE